MCARHGRTPAGASPAASWSQRAKRKRNCVRVTERGKEAQSINCEPMNKDRIEGAVKQGEWA